MFKVSFKGLEFYFWGGLGSRVVRFDGLLVGYVVVRG